MQSGDENVNGGLSPNGDWSNGGSEGAAPSPPPPRQNSPLGFGGAEPVSPPATPAPPAPPAPWSTETPGVAPGSYATATMAEPAPVPPPLDAGSSKLPWIVAVVAAVVLLGGGAFFAASVFGAVGGADSPEEAMDAMIAALENEDFVTAAELMEPAERRTIAEPILTNVLPELVRLGVLDESTEASNVEDLDIDVSDVEYRVEELVGVRDIAHVYVTGGSVDVDGDIEQLGEGADTPLVLVERDGRWYYSALFTIAEAARLEAGEPMPVATEAPAPIPSDSPEAAVEGMMNAVSDLNLRSMIGHMDPDEMAALYRYSPIFLDEAQAELDEVLLEALTEGVSWDITDFEFDVDQSGDDAIVSVRGFTVTIESRDFDMSLDYRRDSLGAEFLIEGGAVSVDATTTQFDVDATVDGEQIQVMITADPEALRIFGNASAGSDTIDGELTLDPEGNCSSYSIVGTDGTNESGCLETEADGEYLVGPIIEAMEDWPSEFPGLEIQVRQTDGGWYVSPMGTIFNGVTTTLEGIEEGDFENLFDDVASGVTSDVVEEVADDFLFADDFTDEVVAIEEGALPEPLDRALESVTVLNYDGTSVVVDESLSPGGIDIFEFTLDAGETAQITAIADGASLDTVLYLTDEAGVQLGTNDDALSSAGLPSAFDSQLVFTAPTAGVYKIEIEGYGLADNGGYQLLIEPGDAVGVEQEDGPELETPLPTAESIGTLEVARGATLSLTGFVGGSQGDPAYDIELTGGEELIVTVESVNPNDLDPRVTLTLDGFEIGVNDDAFDSSAVADSYDSQLILTVPEDGVYQVIIDGFADSEGDFNMTVERN